MAQFHEMFGVELGRIMAAKLLGSSPDIDLFVIDLTQGVAVDGPYSHIEVRSGAIYLFTKVTFLKLVEEELRRLQDHFNIPRLPKGQRPVERPRPRPPINPPDPNNPLPSPKKVPVLLERDTIPIDLRKQPDGSWSE